MRSGKVFGPHFRDALPGRAPTRALYRVRAVNPAGVAGPWSDLLGPIYVPDVRPPASPNLVSVTVPRPNIADPQSSDRRLILEWTQAGPLDDLRFDIESKERDTDEWRLAAIKPRGTPPVPGSSQTYRHVVTDLIPGEKRQFRVRAVREARDPIDPFGQVRRDIASTTSVVREGRALGSLLAPGAVAAETNTPTTVRLRWQNRDVYASVEIMRKGPGELHFRRASSMPGAVQEFIDATLTAGHWRYYIRALGASRKADSTDVGADIP